MSAGVATSAVEACVGVVYRHGEGLDSLSLVRFLLQEDGACRGRRVVGSWSNWSWAIGSNGSYWSRAIGSNGSYWSNWSRAIGSNWSWGGVSHLSHVSHGTHVSHLRVVFRVELEGRNEAGVVLTHVISQHVVGQLGGHGGHHLLHLDTLGVPQAGRVDHVQLCSQVGRLWDLASLGWFYILTVNFLRQGISLVLRTDLVLLYIYHITYYVNYIYILIVTHPCALFSRSER